MIKLSRKVKVRKQRETLLISIPKAMAQMMGIEKGEKVLVTYNKDKLIRSKKDGKQHIIQFELKDKGKASSDVIASYDIYAMGTVDKILGKMQDAGAEILDMQYVAIGQSIKYIIRYK